MTPPTERNTMTLKDQYLNQYGNTISAAVALAEDLMADDPATFKAGYSAANAAIAAAEVFGIERSQVEPLLVRADGSANPATPPLDVNEDCGSCGGHIGPSSSFVWHYDDEDCRAIRQPVEVRAV
jgi:hypothetical protein